MRQAGVYFILLVINSFLIAQPIPYPQSTKYDSIAWHWDTYKYEAIESDLWPVTWAYDDNIYTSWGDGGGFKGDNKLGRVSLGFGRIEGTPENYTGVNVWGGYKAEHPATFKGKCNSIICVDSVLYAWINTQTGSDPRHPDIKLAWSSDLGATWNLSDWALNNTDSFGAGSFINFGMNNQGCFDDYIYCTCGKVNSSEIFPVNCYLMRTLKSHILEKDRYEFFNGLDDLNNPIWSTNIQNSKPIFTDPNGVDGPEIIYNQKLQLYILVSGHYPSDGSMRSTEARLGIFIAPKPWGPWSTVGYYENWGNFGEIEENLGYHIPVKWISEDGKSFWVTFSSGSYLDRFNLVEAVLIESKIDTIKDADTTLPTIPQNLKAIEVEKYQVGLKWSPSSDPESGIKAYNIYRDNKFIGKSDSTFYIDSGLSDNTTYIYKVTSLNNIGLESEKSEPLSVKTEADTVAPEILNIYFKNDSTKLYVHFSKKVDKTSAEDINNYQISGGLKIFSLRLDSTCTEVELLTEPHKRLVCYRITINSIYDRAVIPNVMEKKQLNYLYPGIYLLTNVTVHSGKSYEVMDLFEGNEPVYIDNDIKFYNIELPETIGSQYLKTSNSDRHSTGDIFLNFELNLPSDIYILHDNRIINKPLWIKQFYNTGGKAGIGKQDFTFFKKTFLAGIVTLGGNVTENDTGNYNMYSVIIKPADLTGVKDSKVYKENFKLFQNYPNPFNPFTIITFYLPEAGTARLRIYNLLGENIINLQKEVLQPGTYHFEWNGKDNNGINAASGVYCYELIFTGDKLYKAVNKMVFLK